MHAHWFISSLCNLGGEAWDRTMNMATGTLPREPDLLKSARVSKASLLHIVVLFAYFVLTNPITLGPFFSVPNPGHHVKTVLCQRQECA